MLMWLRTDLTAFTVSQQTLILSATIHCTLILIEPQHRVT